MGTSAVTCLHPVPPRFRVGFWIPRSEFASPIQVPLPPDPSIQASLTMDAAAKQESAVVSNLVEAGSSDSLYFIIGNVDNQLSGLVAIQLFATPDAAKFDPAGAVKPAFTAAAP
jgi:hypothetical protein